jgi:hypothetical protein
VSKPNNELISYIEKHLEKGFKLKHIKRKLAEVGHPIEAIEEAAAFVVENKPHLLRKKERFMVAYGVVLIILLVVGIGFLGYTVWQQQEAGGKIKDTEKFNAMSDAELLRYAAENEELMACKYIEGHNALYACTGRYWEKKFCDYYRLINKSIKGCHVMERVGKTNFLKYCKEYETTTDCVSSVALGENDSSFCGGNSICEKRFYTSQGTVEACKKLDRGDSNICIYELAKTKNDKTLCENYDLSWNHCAMHFMSEQELVEYYNTQYSKISEQDKTEQVVFNFVDEFNEVFEQNMCDSITGAFSGVQLKEYCLLFRVQTDRVYSTAVFDSVKNTEYCAQITNERLKNCCVSALSERFIIPACAFWY